jgi:hypothetical protein
MNSTVLLAEDATQLDKHLSNCCSKYFGCQQGILKTKFGRIFDNLNLQAAEYRNKFCCFHT